MGLSKIKMKHDASGTKYLIDTKILPTVDGQKNCLMKWSVSNWY